MKKIIALILALTMALSFAACSSSNNSGDAKGDSMTLTEIMETITDGLELPATENIPLTEENFEFYTFISPVEGAEGLATEPMMSSIAHSVVLIRLPDNADAQSVADSISANADPRKWICVEAEKTVVSVHGNTILLVMSSEDNATHIADSFDALFAAE